MPVAWADRASATYLRTHCPHGISHHLGVRRTTCSTRDRYRCRPPSSNILGLPALNGPGSVSTPTTWLLPTTTPALASWPFLGKTLFALRMRQLIPDSPHKASDTENEHERPALPIPIPAYNEDGYTRPMRSNLWGTAQRPYGARQCDRDESNCQSNDPHRAPPFLATTGLLRAPRHNRDIGLFICLVSILTHHHVQPCSWPAAH